MGVAPARARIRGRSSEAMLGESSFSVVRSGATRAEPDNSVLRMQGLEGFHAEAARVEGQFSLDVPKGGDLVGRPRQVVHEPEAPAMDVDVAHRHQHPRPMGGPPRGGVPGRRIGHLPFPLPVAPADEVQALYIDLLHGKTPSEQGPEGWNHPQGIDRQGWAGMFRLAHRDAIHPESWDRQELDLQFSQAAPVGRAPRTVSSRSSDASCPGRGHAGRGPTRPVQRWTA